MNYKFLNAINNAKDLRKLSKSDLPLLAKEIRNYIIEIISKKEGHLGASLGTVELTIALHYVYNTPDDVLIWDVGHQAYGHKIICERKDAFKNIREINSISGFPKISESIYDAFGVGHSSTSISAVLGMAIASDLNNDNTKEHIAVIGDASLASGMAFEGLNHAGVTNVNMLVILNDNDIGIDPSVGALKEYLKKLRTTDFNKKCNFFTDLNFEYFGTVDGHNLDELLNTLEHLKTINGKKFLHVITTKGKGLPAAENNQVLYHAPGKFDALTGKIDKENTENTTTKFQEIFGKTLVELATNNNKIIAITPAMPTGSGLKYMMQDFPERTFDVGIAEPHAVTLAAGMATKGFTVFCCIYSTFLQRAYDQIIHDVALQNIPIIFCIDRAGLVGEDGATHHGVFDISFLNPIPNIIIAAPIDEIELRNLLYTASLGLQTSIAIRYPRGKGLHKNWKVPFKEISIGKANCLKKGNKIAVLSTGFIGNNVIEALSDNIFENLISHYHFVFIKPLDTDSLQKIAKEYSLLITIEDGIITGGFGSLVNSFVATHSYSCKVINKGIDNAFVEHGSINELQKLCKLDAESLYNLFCECLQKL